MKNVIVPLNAFDSVEVIKNGQESFVKLIAESGAFGIEVRRELLPKPVQERQLELIRDEIEVYRLFTVYSAPIELWNENHQLNKEELTEVFQEAIALGADWIKVSLGHYHREDSEIVKLNNFLNQHQGFQLLVENDQTLYGGNVGRLKTFFESANVLNVPVKMTFDAGNWYFTSQDAVEALHQLAPYVIYLHLKNVEKKGDELITVPLEKEGEQIWKNVMQYFPGGMTKALEFPIEPKEKTKDYIHLLNKFMLESEGIS
ncbi:xylose isomerase [Bacillus sp. AFS001701]|uniref:sugar phosphate isomerase/epimerase family protein n=1 Tax=Bacillus sp. AFS001701 TaxID=2033480 RepID=UPI000BFA4DA9|nr:sugar phosphate isomerase/epimerase [Bacillus sp. AFS001701]PET76362.1 xylose isomerase [Bacillus sp. AFS001701]